MGVIEINNALQIAGEISSGIRKIYNKVKEGTNSRILAAFDCEKYNNNEYYIEITLYNSSNEDIAELDILCNLNDELIPITNSMILPKGTFINRRILRVFVSMDGIDDIITLNGKMSLMDKEQIVIQVDGSRYKVEIDFKEIVSYIVWI